ncbi:MAG: RloB family protein [Pseudonocardiaceae bacterium]
MCNGNSTEPTYFHELKRSLRNSAVKVKIAKKTLAPEGLVKFASEITKCSGDDFDQVWCVMDFDDFDFERAKARAENFHVQLAVSNPCFELWLLLHHRKCTAPLCDEKHARHQLRKYVPEYKKNDLRFERFKRGVADAIQRAECLDPTGRNYGRDPSSGVWKLVLLIMNGQIP